MIPWTEQARTVLSSKVGAEALVLSSKVGVEALVLSSKVGVEALVVVVVMIDCFWVSVVPECQVILLPELPDQISWELHTAQTTLDPSW